MAVESNKREPIVQGKRTLRKESEQDQRLVQEARKLLEQHPHFRGLSQFLEFQVVDHILRLDGHLPSYFLKQLAQEAVRELDGIREVENQIVVVNSAGEIRESSLTETIEANEWSERKKPR